MSEFNKVYDSTDFTFWFVKHWCFAGGLISKAVAARLLGLSSGRISQMVREQKLREYRYKDISFVSFSDVFLNVDNFCYVS